MSSVLESAPATTITSSDAPSGWLLRTRKRRLFTFFILYFTEGLPQGFTSVAMATWLRRSGADPESIGYFVAALYIPWSWKWTMGPLVDLVFPKSIGKSRFWIVTAQALMIVTLLALMQLDAAAAMTWAIALVLIHNVFAALQDVAIDGLACKVLSESERGTANGLMFAGAYLGNAIGGAGVLILSEYFGRGVSLCVTPLLLLAVMLGVSVWLREPSAELDATPPTETIASRLVTYLRTVRGAFFGSARSVLILLFALLPAGAFALSMALQSNLAVELGIDDSEIGRLGLFSAVLSAGGCILGGFLSDRFGRRKMIALYIFSTAFPTIALGLYMQDAGWIYPLAEVTAARPRAAPQMINAFWAACLIYSFLQGLMYGTRTAQFMDFCKPAIAATQFTAYMSVLNLVTAYTAAWQGRAVVAWGYPTTLFIDAVLGCLCLLILPFLAPKKAAAPIQS